MMCPQVRTNLHVILCFSPVGEKLRVRARQFPALVNCTSLDWLHPWPAEVSFAELDQSARLLQLPNRAQPLQSRGPDFLRFFEGKLEVEAPLSQSPSARLFALPLSLYNPYIGFHIIKSSRAVVGCIARLVLCFLLESPCLGSRPERCRRPW